MNKIEFLEYIEYLRDLQQKKVDNGLEDPRQVKASRKNLKNLNKYIEKLKKEGAKKWLNLKLVKEEEWKNENKNIFE